MNWVLAVWGVLGTLVLFLLIVWIFSGSLEIGRNIIRNIMVWAGLGIGVAGLVALFLFMFSWIKNHINWVALAGSLVFIGAMGVVTIGFSKKNSNAKHSFKECYLAF